MWIGDPPLVLRRLTFTESLLIARHYARCYVFKLYPKDGSRGHKATHLQRGMAGNVMLYEVNTSAVASMLEGALLLQTVDTLSSIMAITFIGTCKLPTDCLSHTFKVRHEAVHDALQWLHQHNNLYSDIVISSACLSLLPDNQIPQEIEAVIRYEEDDTVMMHEREGYAMDNVPATQGELKIQSSKSSDNPQPKQIRPWNLPK